VLIQVATVNGSGSQTANSVLMRAIFQMGIPVSGKRLPHGKRYAWPPR
jgi:2-oxoglutarate ferredoxin oxidoreductase subunit alpha